MIKRVCAAAAVSAVAGGLLFAVPAHADDVAGPWDGRSWATNWSRNSDSTQSGNNFADVFAANRGQDDSTNVNNVNGIAPTATNGGITVIYIFD
ncbi:MULTISPECIES: hypothetical protein [Nonomuraea]|uniref:Pectate lyase n=2 Tax=Nonomuraea TaxID=83681 RepID=A0A4R4WYG1_9ACTN|nr:MULTISPECIES: hypothetical protein [Nonomuraea]TDD11365.1 hypothetical protein E1292_05445 [Nonomuraea deserti]TDD22884.1 hypothetical protein E1294_10720 [Nonomuraea diastatica]